MDQNTNAIAGVEAQREETVNAPALADSTGSTDKAMKARQRLTISQKAAIGFTHQSLEDARAKAETLVESIKPCTP